MVPLLYLLKSSAPTRKDKESSYKKQILFILNIAKLQLLHNLNLATNVWIRPTGKRLFHLG